MMLLFRPGAQTQMLEIEHLGPRITEVRNPWDPGGFGKLQSDKMHRLRRSGCHDRIHGMLPEVFLEESDRRAHPHHSRVGDEEIAPDEEGNLLLEGFLLGIDRIDFPAGSAGLPAGSGILGESLDVYGTVLAHQHTVGIVRLDDLCPDDLSLRRNL